MSGVSRKRHGPVVVQGSVSTIRLEFVDGFVDNCPSSHPPARGPADLHEPGPAESPVDRSVTLSLDGYSYARDV